MIFVGGVRYSGSIFIVCLIVLGFGGIWYFDLFILFYELFKVVRVFMDGFFVVNLGKKSKFKFKVLFFFIIIGYILIL